MIPVLTAGQMREVDRFTIEELGLPGAVLMESAGRSVVDAMFESPALGACSSPLILCGKGNNGGDGFVAARWLKERCAPGWPRVLLAGRLDELSGDAALMAAAAVNFGVNVIELTDDTLHLLAEEVSACDVVVDGLLGSGAAGAPCGIIAGIVETVNEYSPPLVAIDSPTGVEMDTGAVPGDSLGAVLTVTFGYEKPGHRFYPGRARCGEVICADVGFPRQALDRAGCKLYVCEREDVRRGLPSRRPDSNKGDFGKLLVIGGSTGLTGAPVMSSLAAMAVGAGMVTAAVPESLNNIFETKLTEVMTLPLPDDGAGNITADAVDKTAGFIDAEMDVVALGPGIGRSAMTAEFVRRLAPRLKVPVVVDADGLNAFAGKAKKFSSFGGPVVITPHPGEMSRISGKTVKEIVADPVKAARDFSASTGATVLLKGPPTVIAQESGRTVISPTGSHALAKAGSGDVLTGVIAALIAQGTEPFAASFCGAWLHGTAGELAGEVFGEYSVLASHVTEALGEALAVVRDEV
ncbi:MAG: NAD(P)H-hydrate dehydratase [Candidatus Glassbacteria bacterium]|nr:NAD(P)H-hydrate dehydratase [Candidatus Glassbacteria bacterium]